MRGQKESTFINKDMTFNAAHFKKYYPHSIGQIARPGENPFGQGKRGLDAVKEANVTNAIQRYMMNHTRLGIPVLFHDESLHGYVGPNATSFPIPMALGSSRPIKELRGFKKIALKPGETKTVSFFISPDDLAFYNAKNKFTVESGKFDVMIGSSSRASDLQHLEFTVADSGNP